MAVGLNYFVILAIIHYIADYLLQSREIADNKSKNIKYLLIHGSEYTLSFGLLIALSLVMFMQILPIILVIKYSVINGVIHTIIDFFTSQLSSKFYAKKNYSGFFRVLGLDQLLHITTIILTFNIFI
jgi:hypothetical protein